MGIAIPVVTLLVLLIVGAVLWMSSGQKGQRERRIGQLMVTVGVLGLLMVMGLISLLGRIL
ncbi:hypothetical protein F8S09_08015 [Deinococcus sp. SDU3-2]|uniref:Uncharacterized protein n=1 Tax=Deinococcus terrestris TaxID=2651870 RepID=A0A7X1TRP7_9DEIO|nr:hypothetical protein [Deinococcus terrestris]MPY66639.1 hypothetical protein [Deinococcus terrestris]